jgi:hypothetical protein
MRTGPCQLWAETVLVLAGPPAADLRALLAERGVREGLERVVQHGELAHDRGEVLARVESPVDGAELRVQLVEPLEQGVELAISDVVLFHEL